MGLEKCKANVHGEGASDGESERETVKVSIVRDDKD